MRLNTERLELRRFELSMFKMRICTYRTHWL